jgi:hypothetical protein
LSANQIHVNDAGTVIQITVKDGDAVVDLSLATIKQFVFGRPDKTTFSVTAAFVTDGTDGKLQYVTTATTLDTNGEWNLQVIVELPAGLWHSDVGNFTVWPNLN